MAAYKPYILATPSTDLDSKSIQGKLTSAGFKVLGTHSPSKSYTTVSFTRNELDNEAAQASLPFGAVLRVSLFRNDNGTTELSYCSPHYWAFAMGLKGVSSDTILRKLQETLGFEEEFGSKKGLTKKKLGTYNYAMGMPRLADLDKLHKYSSHDEALEAVRQGISTSTEVKQVYQLDVKNSKNKKRLIGVALVNGKGSDDTVLAVTDTDKPNPKMGGMYGPYEILIDNGQVVALRGRFRIAVAFPDLSMGTFMKIVSAPGAILDALKNAATSQSNVVQ